MKQLLLMSLVSLICFSCNENKNSKQSIDANKNGVNHQDNTIKESVGLDGLGTLKINRTTISDLGTLPKIKTDNFDIIDIRSVNHPIEILKGKEREDVNYGYDENVKYWDFAKGYRIAKYSKFKIGDKVIDDLYLYFYQDTLFEINTYWYYEIVDAFDYKFGKPLFIKKSKLYDTSTIVKESGSEEWEISISDCQRWHNKHINADHYHFSGGKTSFDKMLIYDIDKMKAYRAAKEEYIREKKRLLNKSYDKF